MKLSQKIFLTVLSGFKVLIRVLEKHKRTNEILVKQTK